MSGSTSWLVKIQPADPQLLLLTPHQRVSKDYHDQLGDAYVTGTWSSIEPHIKATLRRQLKELCIQKGLFLGKDIDPALEWRLYQLQRNRRAELRKVNPSQWPTFTGRRLY